MPAMQNKLPQEISQMLKMSVKNLGSADIFRLYVKSKEMDSNNQLTDVINVLEENLKIVINGTDDINYINKVIGITNTQISKFYLKEAFLQQLN
jgi:hypothetical protein